MWRAEWKTTFLWPTKPIQTWHKQQQPIHTANNANIFSLVSTLDAIFHIDQFDLLSVVTATKPALFYSFLIWGQRERWWEKNMNNMVMLEWMRTKNTIFLLSGKAFLWWWIAIHWDEIGLSFAATCTTQFFMCTYKFLFFALLSQLYFALANTAMSEQKLTNGVDACIHTNIDVLREFMLIKT